MSRSSLLTTKLDPSDSPLHIAAFNNDFVGIYELIKLGTKVDVTRSDGKTPLMLAVARKCRASIEALLGFGANIDTEDDNGESALSTLFKVKDYHPEIIVQFLRLVPFQLTDIEDVVDRLFRAGCPLFHAAFFQYVEVTDGLLARGVKDYDSRYFKNQTALHIAVDSDKLDVGARLLDVGANVNAVDEDGRGALCMAATNGNALMVKLLLQRGADPNAKAFDCQLTPLIAAMENSDEHRLYSIEHRQHDECVKLLLQFGAVPTQKIGSRLTVFDEALKKGNSYRIDLVISHLALQEMQGVEIAETMMQCKLEENRYAIPKFRQFYETCQRTLKIKMFKSLTVFDLLSASEYKFRVYMRNKEFYRTVADSLMGNSEISEMNPYYYDKLTNQLCRAPGAVLERKAIAVVCEIFGSDYNRYYVVAREVIGYLWKSDLERLCQV